MSDANAHCWFGTDEPRPKSTDLKAGPLTAEFVDGALRAVRWHGQEVLRGVAYVVRDRDWGTIEPAVQNVDVHQDGSRFQVEYAAVCGGAQGATLSFRATIVGQPDGTLTFEVEAVADRDFETNRCGFCVLHPVLGVAGGPATVEHVDGTVRATRFPDTIEPWQPFKDLRAITHEVAPGLRATCRMEGDTFEMEDQRNWSDASYKTYVRPLALPWPYRVPAGVPQRQRVTLTINADSDEPHVEAVASIRMTLGDTQGRMPRIGLAVAPGEVDDLSRLTARLRAVGPQVLLLHFDPMAGHSREAMRRLAAARSLLPGAEAVLECVLPGAGDPATELREVATMVRDAGLALDAIAVSPSVDRQSTPPGSAWPDCPPLAEIYAAARSAFPGLRLGGGMFSYFTELNRKRPPVDLLDFVTHCTCPIVHAADDVSVMQSLEALPFIVRSARVIIGDKPYRIGPSTIGMRQNPYGSRTFPNPDQGRLSMTHDDPRQRGLFAAAWLVGYVGGTAAGDLDVLTVGALSGAFGLMPGDGGSVFPVYHPARGLAALGGAARIACTSTRPDQILGVASWRDGRAVMWLANLTDAPRDVVLPEEFGRAVVFDHQTWPTAAGGDEPPAQPVPNGSLTLNSYAVARLDG